MMCCCCCCCCNEKMDRNTRFVASAHPPHTSGYSRKVSFQAPIRGHVEQKYSYNSKEYYNNDATQINETGTLPSNKSINFCNAGCDTGNSRKHVPCAKEKHRNIRRIIRRMEKLDVKRNIRILLLHFIRQRETRTLLFL